MKIKLFFLIAILALFGAATAFTMAKEFTASIITRPGIATAHLKLKLDPLALSAALEKCVNPAVKLKIIAQNTQKTAARFDTVQLFAKDGSLIGLNKASKTDALASTPLTYSFDFPLSSADIKKGVDRVSVSFIDAGGDDSSGKVIITGALVSIECQKGDVCISIPDAVVAALPLPPPTVASIQTRPVIRNLSGVAAAGGVASTAGPSAGGTFSSGGSGIAWTSPGNAISQNAIYASVTLNPVEVSQNLQARNFGFSIPSTATINGIEFVVVLKYTGPNNMIDNSIKFVKAGTAVGTDFSRGSGVSWPTADTAITFGGSTELAGVSWTPSDINNTNFGINVSATPFASGSTGVIDYISAKVYYTTGSASVYDALRGFPHLISQKFFCAILRQKCE